MAWRSIILLCLLTLTIRVNGDIYDLFQPFQPFLQNYQTARPDYSIFDNYSSKQRESNRRQGDSTEERRRYDRTEEPVATSAHRSTSKHRRKTTPVNIEHFTTHRPYLDVIPKTTRKNKNNSSQNNESNRNKNLSTDRRQFYKDTTNKLNIEQVTTGNPIQSKRTTKRAITKSDRLNQNFNTYTIRPGVKPALVDTNKPPITNRPPTSYAVYPRPTDSSVIRFPENDDTSPEVLAGPDEEQMSSVEKRRYINLAEKMCEKYKALSIKKVEAIPLLPSPEPVQLNVSVCPPSNVPLVVGGKVVTIEEFPHMALLGWTNTQKPGYSWKCGGSLISDQYVLTAGHCAYQEKDDSVVTGAPRVVQLGSSYMDDTGALVVKVLRVVRHPKYIRPSSYYDIALVKLVKPVTFSQVVKPACLGEPPGVGEPIIATGWGQTRYGGSQSLELRSVSVPIWDMDKCKEVLGVSRKMPNGPSRDSQICAGTTGKDTCQGDSGGPAQIQDGCAWRVVAVTSIGRSCGAPNTPALYATLHRAFISAQVFGKNLDASEQTNKKKNENAQSRPVSNNQNTWNSNSQTTNGNRNNNDATWNTNSPTNNNADRNDNWSSNNQQSANNGNRNNNDANWNTNNPNTNNNGNRNNKWSSNSEQSANNGDRINNGASWITNSPSANTNWNSNQQDTNNNRNNNNNGNNNWNNNQQNTNNGNRNNNDGIWNSNPQYTNNNANVNNNWNSKIQDNKNDNYHGIWNANNENTNNNGNVNNNNDYWNGNNDRTQNYNNDNSNFNYNDNKNTNSGSYVETESTTRYNYNNNNNRDNVYYNNHRTTTIRPNYNSGWFNYNI